MGGGGGGIFVYLWGFLVVFVLFLPLLLMFIYNGRRFVQFREGGTVLNVRFTQQ